jgi:hypothetical protein
MSKLLAIVLLCFALAVNAWSQEDPTATESDEPEAVSEVAAEEPEEVDDLDLDEQTYEEDEDDFVPTEEIPVDTSIPFPSNI